MFERFDTRAREVFHLAGELAARKVRNRTGEDFPLVRVAVVDMREAMVLLAPERGWHGGMTPALAKRFEQLPPSGVIGVAELRDALRR